jgi:hypothetical protein
MQTEATTAQSTLQHPKKERKAIPNFGENAVLSNPGGIPIVKMFRHIWNHGPLGPKTAPIEGQTLGNTYKPGFYPQGASQPQDYVAGCV